MPEFIESVYVHRPVREADIPRRGALTKRARGKGKRARVAPAATEAPIPPMTIQSAPPGPWSTVPRQALFRPVPPARKSRLGEGNLTPLVTTLFFVWVGVCCVFQILG